MSTSNFAIYTTPMAYIYIAYKGERLTSLEIRTEIPLVLGTYTDFTDRVYKQIMEYIKCERATFDIDIDLSGCTPFQTKVYEELLKIPYGEKRSYKDIATAIGNPSAARAIGMANNRNPIQLIIPCHRVVGASGASIGYKAGVEIQDFLLELERLSLREELIYDKTKN